MPSFQLDYLVAGGGGEVRCREGLEYLFLCMLFLLLLNKYKMRTNYLVGAVLGTGNIPESETENSLSSWTYSIAVGDKVHKETSEAE